MTKNIHSRAADIKEWGLLVWYSIFYVFRKIFNDEKRSCTNMGADKKERLSSEAAANTENLQRPVLACPTLSVM